MRNTRLAPIVTATVALLAACLAGTACRAAEAGGACVRRPAPAGAVGKRVAAIVGDGAYRNGIPALPNPTHDAEAVAKAMGELGFEVFLSENADSSALQKCLGEAYADLAGADVAMLYYSGHGIQIQDANYLVATDAGTNDLQHGFVAVQPIVDAMQKQAKATLVLLDACRNNPLTAEAGVHAGLSVSTGRGLARVKDAGVPANAPIAGTPGVVQARGLMVAYATSPNAVAQDGTGSLSPFTGAFVKDVGTSGFSIQRVMSQVNKDVGEATDYTQTPWMKSSLTGELKLGGGETLAQAQSVSDNHAARALTLLDTDGKKDAAIVEALKGLPASRDAAILKRFPKAYDVLYRAVQSSAIVLPLTAGMNLVAVSPRDRAAVYKLNPDYQGGTFQLWSVSEQKVVADPDVGRGGASEQFTFSPHGTLLGAVSRNTTDIFDGLDGHKLFQLRASSSHLEFSPDESRLLLEDESDNRFTIIDVATRKPTMVVKKAQLDPGSRKARSTYMSKTAFGGNDKVCFILHGETGNQGVIGVFDLAADKVSRVREVEDTGSDMMCDPTGHYMVRTLSVGGSDHGMEIWDLVADKVSLVSAPIVALTAIEPEGRYVSVLAFLPEAQGLYDLATGKKKYPPTIPAGFWVVGPDVRSSSGGLGSRDTSNDPWRDWPNESLFGPALVAKALAGLTPTQRAEVARDRITYSVVAADP